MSSEAASAMGEENKPALVPRLRFPEFREAGGWIAKSLKNACEVNPANSELPDKFAYIDLESVEAGELKARRIINRDEAPSRAQRLLRNGDVIFQIVRPYQRNNLHFKVDEEVPYVASTGYAQLRANESEDFLFQAVHTDDFVERVIAKCTGSSYPAINSSDLADISLATPGTAEQQKIADCLSSLDELITAETQKLDALKIHKKGLMQQLFPREGETVPRLRFPEFREAPAWNVKTLDKTSPSIFDGTHQTPKYAEEGVPFFSVENIVSGNRNKFISEEDHIIATRKNKPEQGDILVTRIGNIGYTAVVHWDYQFSIYVTLAVVKGAPSFDSYFLHGYFQSSRYQKEILRKSLLNAVPCKINMEELRKTEVLLPEIDEQHKIADCLSSLDDLITAQSQKIDALKTHKKGLMQQLFPVLDEVQA